MSGAQIWPSVLEPSDRPQPNARQYLLPEIVPAVWLPQGCRREATQRQSALPEVCGLSGCPGLGDLGDHTSLRADIHLHPQAELTG